MPTYSLTTPSQYPVVAIADAYGNYVVPDTGQADVSQIPASHIAENYPRKGSTFANITGPAVAGRMILTSIHLTRGMVVTGAKFFIATTALTRGTGSHVWIALYRKNKTLARQSTSDTATAHAANSTLSHNLTTPYTVEASEVHYMALMVNSGAGGVQPTVSGVSATSAGVIDLLDPVTTYADTGNLGLTDTAPATASTPTSAMVVGTDPYCVVF